MADFSLSDVHAETLKRLADEAGVTADEFLGELIARYSASHPAAINRAEREQRLRELEGKYDMGDEDLSLKSGQIMREIFAAKRD
jgi:hypothetical protein